MTDGSKYNNGNVFAESQGRCVTAILMRVNVGLAVLIFTAAGGGLGAAPWSQKLGPLAGHPRQSVVRYGGI